MFHLGLEFDQGRLKKVWWISLAGSAVIFGGTVVGFVGVGRMMGVGVMEGVVIGASVFLSSTAVVLHFLKSEEQDLSYGRQIMGILVA